MTERISVGAEEYRTLSRKYALLQSSKQLNHDEEEFALDLCNSSETQENQEDEIPSERTSLANTDIEVKKCPMCFWEFPSHMNVDGKREHIEHHFQ